jgi:hypothetical protein
MQPPSGAPKRLNTYLALREAKIARNNARLQELGLLASSHSRKAETESSLSRDPSSTLGNKRRRIATNIDSHGLHAVTERRKSQRLCPSALKIESVDVTSPPSTDFLPPTVGNTLEPSIRKTEPTHVATLVSLTLAPASSKISGSLANSAREIHLNVSTLFFGSVEDASDMGLLGRPMPFSGKAIVIEESARRAGNVNPIPRISFNKYSGVQEWGNNVLYLWINFGAPDSQVENQFFENGRKVNWFGGSRMHDATPLICKLKYIGALAAKGVGDSNGAVVLWARQYSRQKKGFDPYVCLGRLSVRTS